MLSGDDAEDVALFHDEQVLSVDLDLGPRPFAKKDAVAGLDIEGDELAGLIAGARTDGDDLAFLRLLLRRVGDDNPALGLFITFETLDDDAIMQRSESHF